MAADLLTHGWEQALSLSWEAFCAHTTPVGAVVVSPAGEAIAAGRGRRYDRDGPAGQLSNSQIAHAEINALAQLSAERHWDGHRLLTTLEPCAMCHGAAMQATVGAVLYGAPDPYGGTATVRHDTPQSRRREIVSGPLADSRGAFATLLHLGWLIERGGRDHHAVRAHETAMPSFTRFTFSAFAELTRLAGQGDYPAARDLARSAPW